MKAIDYLVLFLLLMLAVMVASCTPEINICDKGIKSPGVVCTEIYQPVIAPDGTEYPNACYAGSDGWDNSCLILKEL